MDEETPVKRRKTENLNDISQQGKITKQWSGNVEISALSVKPDKFQKLRRIVRTSCEKTQTRSDDLIISSVGSSPSSSPRPEGLTALSNPVDPTELHARLTVLVREEDKENRSSRSGDGNLQAENKVQFAIEKEVKISEGKSSEGYDTKSKNAIPDKNMNIPMEAEEFYTLLRKMVNEKIKKMEESFSETVIPLEEKITHLQKENEFLQNHAKQLQEYLKKILAEYKKQQEKPAQSHVGVQAGSSDPPPPLTPVQTTVSQTSASKLAPVVHIIDSAPGIYKPPSTTLPHATPVSTLTATNIAHSVRVAASAVNGVRQPVANTGYVYTTASGQPRMYSDAPHKPGSHPNAVVAPRPHSTFVRPSGPVTATVYPQPQNIPTSPVVHRSSPPIPRNQSPPTRFPYNPQTPNGVMLRTHAQPATHMTAQYTVTHERKDNSAGTPVGARHMSASPQGHPPSYSGAPPRPQGPPPSYSVAAARPQQQVSYHPSSAANPAQVNGVRQTHYAVRQAAPAPAMVQNPGPHPHPAGPPPLVRAQPNIHQQQRPQVMQQNISPRYQGPQQTHIMRQRPPYPQNTPTQVVNDPRTQAAAVPPRHHGQVPTVPPLPSQTAPSQANGIVRDLPPPIPTVSISGASNGIVLSWNMTIPEGCAAIDSYQLFAYQNNGHMANTPSLWKKLGIVKALPLPMACTLTQFVSGSMYYFAVRAIDVKGRAGNYSAPCAITLPNESDKGRS